MEKLAKKHKKANVKPAMVKNHLWVFVNSQIENPAFSSQVRCPRMGGGHCWQGLHVAPLVRQAAGAGLPGAGEPAGVRHMCGSTLAHVCTSLPEHFPSSYSSVCRLSHQCQCIPTQHCCCYT